MQVIQMGSIAILLKWLLLGAALFIGLAILKLWLRRTQEKILHKQVIDLFFNSLFFGFICWKGSLFIIDPVLVIKSPLSLLYFTGGTTGLVLAVVGSIIFYFFKANKSNITDRLTLQSGFLYSFTVIGVYHLLATLLLEEQKLNHIILGLYTFAIVIFAFWKHQMVTQQRIFSSLILFSFLSLSLSFLQLSVERKIWFFSAQQWFFVALIIVSLIFWDKKSKS
ncbi:hypothetical protein RCG24_05695 [Neobacillus sp. OS1-32]|uniref:hypothetical protein n=1 Tax=Neobacillus sp. OS1-32 TaxID=3070682 RepID=UPI0027E1418B|nr:hypothetical protein [Neobacillus sp. OS1-32]WML31366.1 hypothetical protein RCG24_05695 [Neobacillus sp. OS1-32]